MHAVPSCSALPSYSDSTPFPPDYVPVPVLVVCQPVVVVVEVVVVEGHQAYNLRVHTGTRAEEGEVVGPYMHAAVAASCLVVVDACLVVAVLTSVGALVWP